MRTRMIGLIVFLVGIFVLFKGSFHLFGRTVPQRQARAIGLILMSPLLIEFCASTLLMYNYVQFNADGTFALDANALQAITSQLGMVEVITVMLAIGLALLNIFNSPQGAAADAPQQPQSPNPFRAQPQQQPAAPVPNIMTVAEAASYMRVSESEVLELINAGKLGAARIGDTYRIARIAIEDFLNPSA